MECGLGVGITFEPDHDVAEANEREGEEIAKDHVRHDEVDRLLVLGPFRPLLHAELDLRLGWERAHQVEVHGPWKGRRESQDPDEEDDKPGTTPRDLEAHRETNGQHSVDGGGKERKEFSALASYINV